MASKGNTNALVFLKVPAIELGSNLFVNCPVVLQYENTPIISIQRWLESGYTTCIPIYHSDGTYLAKVVGSQVYPTDEGKKAGLKIRHENKLTVCEIGGRVAFELRRQEAAALKTYAELYTPDGGFLRFNQNAAGLFQAGPSNIHFSPGGTMLGGAFLYHNRIEGFPVGLHIWKDGRWALGSSGDPPPQIPAPPSTPQIE